ncbi:MAG TPA: hypothetical protein VNQ79_05405 [Blastocatellia bacterium]|nr:hypothetical protein [Blastocatellia bacterium]
MNAEIADARTHLKSPARPQPVKTRHGLRYFAASQPTVWEAGWRTGAALRRAQSEAAEAQGGAAGDQHASPRPHIRRAHWHTFLAGPGRRERLVKWLPPIAVNVTDDESFIPTVRPVE